MSSTICNMLSKIKNASMIGKDFVDVKLSKYSLEIIKVLQSDGYIEGFEVIERAIRINLKYYNGQPVIKLIKAVSTPRRPIYRSAKRIRKMVKQTFTTFIISTNKGVCAHQEALANGVGGQVICEVGA